MRKPKYTDEQIALVIRIGTTNYKQYPKAVYRLGLNRIEAREYAFSICFHDGNRLFECNGSQSACAVFFPIPGAV